MFPALVRVTLDNRSQYAASCEVMKLLGRIDI